MSSGYPVKTTPVIADQAMIWDTENSCYRRVPFSAINALFEATDASTVITVKEPVTQYSAPAAGATVSVTDGEEKDVHLILTPAATLATLTVELPATVRDKQTVLVNCTQVVTTFTVDGNGAASVNGAPTALAANDFFKMKYDLAVDAWYRVG